jgi:hypothetical protein
MESPIIPIIIVVSLLVLLIGVILMMVMRRVGGARRTAVVEKAPFGSTSDPAVLCPKCHIPMNSGFIRAERGIVWRGIDEKPAGAFSMVWTSSVLKNTITMGFKLKVNRAWRCYSCNHILFDQSEQIEPPKKDH